MSVLQVGIPLGIMLGYTSGGYLTKAGLPWYASILVQGA